MEGKLSRRAFLHRAGLAGLGVTLAAAGCQQQPQVVPTAQVIEKEVIKEVVVTPTPAPALSGSIRLWAFPCTENDLDGVWAPLNEKFAKVYPEIKVEVEVLPWGGRREKMLTAYAAGEAPDMAYLNDDQISLWGHNDVLVPLDDVVPAETWADMPPDVAPGISWDGKRIMVPNSVYTDGHVINKALLEEVGLDPENPPYKWDDIRVAAAQAKEKGYYWEAQNTVNPESMIGRVWQAGGTMLNEDYTKSLMDQQPGIDAVTFLTDFFRNGWAPLEGAVGSEEEWTKAAGIDNFMMKKQVAKLLQSPELPQVMRQAPDIELVYVPTYMHKKQVTWAGAGCWGIFKTSKFPEGAGAWINFMSEPENQGLYNSLTGGAPPRFAAQKYWAADPAVKEYMAINWPHAAMGGDMYYYFQLEAVIGAPHWQAAALGLKTPEQACKDFVVDMNKAIADELAKAGTSS